MSEDKPKKKSISEIVNSYKVTGDIDKAFKRHNEFLEKGKDELEVDHFLPAGNDFYDTFHSGLKKKGLESSTELSSKHLDHLEQTLHDALLSYVVAIDPKVKADLTSKDDDFKTRFDKIKQYFDVHVVGGDQGKKALQEQGIDALSDLYDVLKNRIENTEKSTYKGPKLTLAKVLKDLDKSVSAHSELAANVKYSGLVRHIDSNYDVHERHDLLKKKLEPHYSIDDFALKYESSIGEQAQLHRHLTDMSVPLDSKLASRYNIAHKPKKEKK